MSVSRRIQLKDDDMCEEPTNKVADLEKQLHTLLRGFEEKREAKIMLYNKLDKEINELDQAIHRLTVLISSSCVSDKSEVKQNGR